MSARLSTGKGGRRRPNMDLALAGLGVLAAVVWFVWARSAMESQRAERSRSRLDVAERILAHHQALERERLIGTARLLVEDTRVTFTLREAKDGLDRLKPDDLSTLRRTWDDSFKELHDGLTLHLVLSPGGRVISASGAKQLEGADLSATALLKELATKGQAVSSRWFVDGRLVEVAAAPIGEGRPQAIVVVGDAIEEATLGVFSQASQCQIAIVTEGKVSVASPGTPDDAATLASLAAGRQVVARTSRFIDIATALPPARVLLLANKEPGNEGLPAWVFFGPLGAALVFACLAVLRSGR